MDNEITYDFIDVKIPDFNPEFFDLWVRDVIKMYQKELGTLSYVFCSDEYLLGMNRDHLNHDYYTDIITFNYNEGVSLSGDLFISYDRVVDNAKSFDVTPFDELCRVMIHGVLHLVGFNDKTEEDEKEMRNKENDCLNIRKVSRET